MSNLCEPGNHSFPVTGPIWGICRKCGVDPASPLARGEAPQAVPSSPALRYTSENELRQIETLDYRASGAQVKALIQEIRWQVSGQKGNGRALVEAPAPPSECFICGSAMHWTCSNYDCHHPHKDGSGEAMKKALAIIDHHERTSYTERHEIDVLHAVRDALKGDGSGEAPPPPASRQEIREALEAIEKAHAEVCRVHDAFYTRKSDTWRITIPVDVRRDSDIIIGDALNLAHRMISKMTSEASAVRPPAEPSKGIIEGPHE